jgi:anti-sigma factor RsiW
MNCQDFKDVLYEYVDDTLSAEDRRRAHQHLERCADCRWALQRDMVIGRSIQRALVRLPAESLR